MEKFKTETSFPLWLLQCTSLETCAHRGVKTFMSCDTQVAPATKSSVPPRQAQVPAPWGWQQPYLLALKLTCRGNLADTALCLALGPLHPLLVCW